MDKAEQIAADIALTMNGGEWKDGKWYSNGHREAWIKAIQPYADEIEKLREALRFYANRKHYDLFVRSHTSMGEYETSHILDDAGSIAREALGEK